MLQRNIILMITAIKSKILLKSIFLRMREIKHGEKFIATKELYSGDYIIQIAKKILKTDKNIDNKEFKQVSKKVKNFIIKNINAND